MAQATSHGLPHRRHDQSGDRGRAAARALPDGRGCLGADACAAWLLTVRRLQVRAACECTAPAGGGRQGRAWHFVFGDPGPGGAGDRPEGAVGRGRYPIRHRPRLAGRLLGIRTALRPCRDGLPAGDAAGAACRCGAVPSGDPQGPVGGLDGGRPITARLLPTLALALAAAFFRIAPNITLAE